MVDRQPSRDTAGDFGADGQGVGEFESDGEGAGCENGKGQAGANVPGGLPPWMVDLHKLVKEYAEAEVVDGADLEFLYSVLESLHFPFENLTEMLVVVWALVVRPSRRELQLLLDILRLQDGAGNRFNPEDVPRSSEHLISRAGQRLPLLPVLRRNVAGKDGNEATTVECPFNLIYQRMLDCPRIVEELLRNLGGKQLSVEEQSRNQVPDYHFTPIATRGHDGAKNGFMSGEIMKASAHMGLECVATADGVRLMVGVTAMVNVPSFGADPHPCRIAAIFWQNAGRQGRRTLQLAEGKDGFWRRSQLSGVLGNLEEKEEEEEEGAVEAKEKETTPFWEEEAEEEEEEEEEEENGEDEAKDDEPGQAGGAGESAGHLVIEVNPLVRREQMPDHIKSKRRLAEEFDSVWEVTNQGEQVRVDALVGPCMVIPVGASIPVGDEDVPPSMPTFVGEGFAATSTRTGRLQVTRQPWRRSGSHGWFCDRRSRSAYTNEASLPVVSMGFLCSSDGFNYLSGNKKYSIRGTYLAPGCLSGPLLRRLRSWWLVTAGVKARWEEEMAPLTSILKMLENGCRARLRTTDEEATTLGNGSYDFRANERSAEDIDADIAWAREGATATERNRRATTRGVALPDVASPLEKLTFDRQRQLPFDILHQDALAIVAGRLAVRQLLPPNVSPFGDITTDGGWSGLTGNQIWLLSSILGLLFAPIFANPTSLEKYVRFPEIDAVAERIGSDYNTSAGKKNVCQAFRDLIISCSDSTFMVRRASFTSAQLAALEKSQAASIDQASRVMGKELGSFHKGLHLADDVQTLGAVGNANAGEGKHKEVKGSEASSDHRDNEVHVFRVWNAHQALKALCDGVTWQAKGFNHVSRTWETRELRAGPLCQEVLQSAFKILPVQMTAAAPEDGVTERSRGFPHGYKEFDAGLLPSRPATPPDAPSWQQVVAATLPTDAELGLLYDEKLGCGRAEDETPCSSRTCSFCWRNRGFPGAVVRKSVTVFNHWGLAPAEVSAGTGTIRGSPIADAGSSAGWARSTSSRANDVEIYLTPEAQESGTTGLEDTTIGRVAYFFEHQGNDWRRGDSSDIPPGTFTIWVAVSEYVTAGVGNRRKVDPVTGLDEFRMRQALTFYPASAIRMGGVTRAGGGGGVFGGCLETGAHFTL
eukprot:g14422.t1